MAHKDLIDLKDVPATDLLFELKMRGYICYKRGYLWDRCKCVCGYKAGKMTIYKGVYTLTCPKCGRSYTGDSMESAEREWRVGNFKEEFG